MAKASPRGNQVMAEASELGGRTVQTSPGTASFPVARPYANGTIIPSNKPRDRLHPEPSPCLGTAPREALNKNNNILTGTPEHAIKEFLSHFGGKNSGGKLMSDRKFQHYKLVGVRWAEAQAHTGLGRTRVAAGPAPQPQAGLSKVLLDKIGQNSWAGPARATPRWEGPEAGLEGGVGRQRGMHGPRLDQAPRGEARHKCHVARTTREPWQSWDLSLSTTD